MIVYIQGKKLSLNPASSIGKGGEADVFDIQNGLVAKIFKQPDHPDFVSDLDRKAAKIRIQEHQTKLLMFPKNLSNKVITPINLVTNKSGNIILGYTMRFLKGYEVLLRYKFGIQLCRIV